MTDRTKCRPPLLTADEEIELANTIEAAEAARRRIVAGEPLAADRDLVAQSMVARQRFIEANIGLAIHLARKTPAPSHVDREDMIQNAIFGLGRAVDRFDPRRGNRFSTYASWWVRQAIQQGLETEAAPVRIPTHAQQDLSSALRRVNGDANQLPPHARRTQVMVSMASLDAAPVRDGAPLSAAIRAVAADPAETAMRNHDCCVATHLVNELDPTSKFAVGRRFGFGGNEPATFSEIGDDLGVSAEAARRRVHRALDRLRPLATALAA